MLELYPLTFEPLLKERVWGGTRLRALGKALPPGATPVGESWELCDLPDDQSRVAAGPLAGTTLGALVATARAALLGPVALDGGSFPLLVKYIDAAQDLSVQVHPDAATAARLGGRPKSEAWYILDAVPGAQLYLGLREGTSRAALEEALRAGRVAELMRAVPVRAGDVVPVTPGTTHAIGAGVLLAEVQQPSDTTYRVHDWGRLGLDGRPRALHLREALESIHPDAVPHLVRAPEVVDLELFALRVAELASDAATSLAGDGPLVVVGLTGEATIAAGDGRAAVCRRGTVVLLPHACRGGARSARLAAGADPAAVLLVTFPPAAR